MLAGNLFCIYNRICQWSETEHLLRTARKSEEEEEEETAFDPEQLTVKTKKKKERNMPRARGDSMPKLTSNRETLIHRASALANFV